MTDIKITKEIETLVGVYHSLRNEKRNSHFYSQRSGLLAESISYVIRWEALREWVNGYDGNLLQAYTTSKEEVMKQFEESVTKFEKNLDIEGCCDFEDDEAMFGDSPMFECIISIPKYWREHQVMMIKKDATKVVEDKINILTELCENELLISPEELMNVYSFKVYSSGMERGDEYIFENFVMEIAIEKLQERGYNICVKEYTSKDDDKTHKIIIGKKATHK